MCVFFSLVTRVLDGGGGGGGVGTQKAFIWGRVQPLTLFFCIPFLTEKVPLSYP